MVWSSSTGGALRAYPRIIWIRRLVRICALLALIRLPASPAQCGTGSCWPGRCSRPPGSCFPAGMAVIAGTLILLRGVAVALGVSDPRRRLDGAPGGADFFGFGTRPYPGPPGQNRT